MYAIDRYIVLPRHTVDTTDHAHTSHPTPTNPLYTFQLPLPLHLPPYTHTPVGPWPDGIRGCQGEELQGVLVVLEHGNELGIPQLDKGRKNRME